ncbi:hypothetical protein LINPERHAP2_LOCUS19731, partial [Linum perenne]
PIHLRSLISVLTAPKVGKKKKTETTTDPSDTAWERRLGDLVANSKEHTKLAREREDREKARDARDKMKQDMDIMMMDISQVSPSSRPWFQAQKDAILASYHADPNTTPNASHSNDNPWDDTYSPDV